MPIQVRIPLSSLSLTVVVPLQLSVKGYNDKQHILLQKIMEKMTTFEIDEKRFDIIKEAVICPPPLLERLLELMFQ